MSDIEFVNGLIVKAPHAKAPEFVKCAISIKRQELIDWLKGKTDEWVNVDVKESRNGKWFASVNDWKPEGGKSDGGQSSPQQPAPQKQDGGFDDIPF